MRCQYLTVLVGRNSVNRPIVTTTDGSVRGVAFDGGFAFRGVPYAANTSETQRFQPARRIAWSGVRDAARHGPRAPQIDSPHRNEHHRAWWQADPQPQSEDCLVLNVYTPTLAETGLLPVMVYLHGGGFAFGSAGAPGIDGANLARRGVVLVSINHRLSVFGHLHLAGEDERYADSGNAGILDIVAALQWVRANIAAFGGDNECVTVFGQSGGGSKVAALLSSPHAHGLFHRAIIQSASSMLRLATLEEAEVNTYHLMRQLDMTRPDLRRLREIPADALRAAAQRGVVESGGIDNYRPVVDGRTILAQPFTELTMNTSGHVPLILGYCETEQRLRFARNPDDLLVGSATATARVASFLSVSSPEAENLMDVYRTNRPDDSPGDIMALVYGDQRYRRTATTAAELRSPGSCAPTYMYMMRWRTPVLNGALRSPHTLCLPFVFGNVDLASGITGNDASRYQLQEHMAGAWVQFARTGDPNRAGDPQWEPYRIPERQTMVFDLPTGSIADPARHERVALARCPAHLPAEVEGGRKT